MTSEIEHTIIVSLSWHSGYIISNRSLSTRTEDCGLRTADCGLRTVDCGLRTADCGLRTADCRLRLWTVDCRLWTADCGLRTADCGLRTTRTNLQQRPFTGADLGGGCRGCAPSPEVTCGFLIQLVFCKKKLCGLLVLK